MIETKRRHIVSAIRARGYTEIGCRVLLTRQEFFDGNDDCASIGCNLMEHPGIESFDSAFCAIETLPEVSSVFFAVAELIDEEGMWPFSDTAYIVTTLRADAFQQILAPLQPDEMGSCAEKFANPPEIPPNHRLVRVWWD